MAITQLQLIEKFINGEEEGYTGTDLNPGTLKIIRDQLIHYDTVILERYNDVFILNTTRYSLQTGKVQKKIKERIDTFNRLHVEQVPINTTQSLQTFLKNKGLK